MPTRQPFAPRRRILPLLLALALALGPGPWPGIGTALAAAPGAAFPDLALDLSAQEAADLGLPAGGPTSLSRVPAQALLVLLVSYFCPPCHKEMPRIKELAGRIKERGLAGRIRLVGLAAGDDQGLVERFKARHGGLPFALAPDPDLAAHKRLGSPAVPMLYAVAVSGGRLRLLSAHQGEFTEAPDAFLDAVLRSLAAPANPAGPAKAPRGR
jgi:thiol-disulfide isomerase/thioredoxin